MRSRWHLTRMTLALFALLTLCTGTPSGAVVISGDSARAEERLKRLAEREAALKAKEEAFQRANAALEAKVRELDAAKKGLEKQISARKSQDGDRYKKMVKIYKTLKPKDAADLLNKLEPKLVITLLDNMDQKTVVKLIPLITQPTVLEWSRQNLGGR